MNQNDALKISSNLIKRPLVTSIQVTNQRHENTSDKIITAKEAPVQYVSYIQFKSLINIFLFVLSSILLVNSILDIVFESRPACVKYLVLTLFKLFA